MSIEIEICGWCVYGVVCCGTLYAKHTIKKNLNKDKYYLNKDEYNKMCKNNYKFDCEDYKRIIKVIKIVFNRIIENSPLIKEVIKCEIIKNMGITNEQYYNIDEDLLEIKYKKILNKLKEEKFELFMERNKDILLIDIYNYLLRFDVYDGDISCELIIVNYIPMIYKNIYINHNKPILSPYKKY